MVCIGCTILSTIIYVKYRVGSLTKNVNYVLEYLFSCGILV